MSGYFDSQGNWVEGATVGGDVGTSVSTLSVQVTSALGRVTTARDAFHELKQLFRDYPFCKDEGRFAEGEHPFKPLVERYAELQME